MSDVIPDLGLPTAIIAGRAVPILDKPYTTIVRAIEEAGDGALAMESFHGRSVHSACAEHFCGSVHCIAGWATRLCGKQGFELERDTSDVAHAASLILMASSPLQPPDFMPEDYANKDDYKDEDEYLELVNIYAMDGLRWLADREAEIKRPFDDTTRAADNVLAKAKGAV